MTADSIRLVIPYERPFFGIARLVVGGLAARLDASYEQLEDLQLALESLLENEAYWTGEDVTVELVVRPGAVELRVGPLDGEELRADLERESGGIGLGRLLRTVVEEVELSELEGRSWLRLEKRIRLAPARS